MNVVFLRFPTSVEDNKSSYIKEECSFFKCTAPQQVCCVEFETLDGDLVTTSLHPVLGLPLTPFFIPLLIYILVIVI